MPHNWIRLDPRTPNPGKWKKADVKKIVEDDHKGKLDGFFHNKDESWAYVLAKDPQDPEGLKQKLGGVEMIELKEAP